MLCLYIADNKLVMSVYTTIKDRKFIMISDYLINARKGTIFFSIPTKNFNNPEMCRSERLVSKCFGVCKKILPLQKRLLNCCCRLINIKCLCDTYFCVLR